MRVRQSTKVLIVVGTYHNGHQSIPVLSRSVRQRHRECAVQFNRVVVVTVVGANLQVDTSAIIIIIVVIIVIIVVVVIVS